MKFIAPLVHAQTTTPPTLGASDLPGSSIALDSIFTTVVKDVFIGLAVVAFIGLIWAGIQYITAGGDPAKAEKARKGIIWTIIGVVLAILSFSIVTYVSNPNGLLKEVNQPAAKSGNGSGSGQSNNGNGSGSKSAYNPCVSETPQGCVDSDGHLTGLNSDGSLASDLGSSSSSDSAGQYGLALTDRDGVLSGNKLELGASQVDYVFGLGLVKQPQKTVTVTVTVGGDLALQLSQTSFTFTPDNYQANSQSFDLQYLGGNKAGETSTLTISGSDGSRRTITVVIQP